MEEKMQRHHFIYALAAALAAFTSGQALASMSGIDWLNRMELIQRSQGDGARKVHVDVSVVRVDPGVALTVLHPEMQSPDRSIAMPAMEMTFHLTDPTQARGIKAGDKIHIIVERVRGAVQITRLRRTL
jgi:Cu/Ag efflux protein CusF